MDNSTFQMLVVTAELAGARLSEGAIRLLAHDLARYSDADIQIALERLRREGARLNLAEITRRMPNLWPSADEAWARLPADETDSACVNAEMMDAWAVVRDLPDKVAARMAFKAHYEKLVAQALINHRTPRWSMSLGTDRVAREQATMQAVHQGLIGPGHARQFLPEFEPEQLQALADQRSEPAALPAPESAPSSTARATLDQLMEQLGIQSSRGGEPLP